MNNVQELQAGVDRFPWGKIVAWHKLGVYDIAEYHPYDETVTGDLFLNSERRMYHGWIDGRDSGRHYGTIERTIVGLIAVQYDGDKTQAEQYFSRMVRLPAQEHRNHEASPQA